MNIKMKKTQNSITEEFTAEASESIKKLYKSITEVSHSLDDQRGRSLKCKDLFTVNIEIQRLKLKNYCEKMIFADPSCYGRKAEEIMWRKTYHDVYSTAKILKTNNIWNNIEVALLENHFQTGIGCYYHILFKFQTEINFEIPGLFDFFKVLNDESDVTAVKKDQIILMKKNDKSVQEEVGMKMIIYRCLICLGDLSRYLYELNKLDLYYLTAWRYYKQALLYKPDNGLPHNQIGRLALTKNNHLDAIYHYIRCVFSVEPFEGGERNLLLSIQQKPEDINNAFLVTFFKIVDIWYNDKDSEKDLDQMYSKIINYFQELCSKNIKNKQELLCSNVESCQAKEDNESLPSYQEISQLLTNENVFKLIVIITACLGKLLKNGSKNLQKAELFFFTLTEQLITQCVSQYSKTLPQLVDPFVDHAKLNRRRRRRGFTKHSSPDSQEWSEGDEEESIISPDDSDDDESEEETLIFDIKSPNDDKNKNESDGSNDSGTSSFDSENKKNKIQVTSLPYAETIHIFLYWIKQQIHSINLEPPLELLTNIIKLLNYISQSNIENDFPDFNADHFLLPEEEHLIGMTTLWESKGLSNDTAKKCFLKNQDPIRIMKILCYAKEIALNNIFFTYNSEKKWFSLSNTLQQIEEKTKLDNKRDKQHVMGQLWLRAEIDNLEVKMKYTSRKKYLPTCIVLDTEALINYSLIVKKLVNSSLFIVVVPAIVISALDEQKKLSKEVRLTIRWLEFQLQQGNCNLKSQGIHESKPIKVEETTTLTTKEMCHFKNILECCNYFTNDCGESNGIVTLLTGSDDLLKSLDMMQMAKSINIKVEHIKKFQMQLKMTKNKS